MKRQLAPLLLLSLICAGCTQRSEEGVAPATSAEQLETPSFEWTMVTTWPKNLPGLGTSAEELATTVGELSNGQLTIKVYGANELVGGREVFDAVAAGTAELGHGAAYYWRGKDPLAALFTTIPFGMTAQEVNSWLRYGGGMELYRELYSDFGVVPLVVGNSGVQMAGWFNREINSLKDLEGLKMRIPGLGGEVLSRVGVVTVALQGPEIFTSMQTGVIDATEWVGPFNDLAFGLHEVAEYYYYPGWHEPAASIELLVNAEAWSTLPAHLQKMLEVASLAANQDMLDLFNERNAAALKTLIEEHGVKVRKLPDDVLDRLQEVSLQVLNEQAGDDEFAQRVVTSYQNFQEQVSEYIAISEYAYLKARYGD